MASALNYGLMAHATKANGETIKQTDKENWCTLMVTSMRENG